MSYPTQEEELRAREAEADEKKNQENSKFISTFESTASANKIRLGQLASQIIMSFDTVLSEARKEPFERQEKVMEGLERLFNEQINVIDSRRMWAKKLNPDTPSQTSD